MSSMSSSSASYLTPFAKSVLTGLFAGIASTFLCIIYNIIYRDETSFPLFTLINVSSMIFVINLLFTLIGVVYYWFIKYIKRGHIVFIAAFILITLLCVLKIDAIHRSSEQAWNAEFHSLMIVMTIIMGLAAAVGIPVLYHSKWFEENVV